ncbi:holo-ACP synthase [Streptomyces bluensis]|uniref:holo-ACP synthase n=1 Tax=Streptomyces bluensis TaxID=33897 RepID=UPI00331996F8
MSPVVRERTPHGSAIRVGIDVLDRGELRRLIGRTWFLRFGYAPEELAHAEALGGERRLEFLAGRFAAKEAVLKTLGTGMLRGIAPHEICVDRDAEGSPLVRLRGRAAALAPASIALSITHKQDVVAAVAVAHDGPGRTATAAAPTAAAKAGTRGSATSATPGSTTPGTPGRKEPVSMSADVVEHTGTTTAFLRTRIGEEDAHYGGGLVDGARVLRLFGDLVTEITVRTDGDEGLLVEYSDVRFTAPVRPGDYIEASARLVHRTRLRRVVELQAHKVIASRPGARPTAAEVLGEPELVCSATATTVVPLRRPHTRQGAAATTAPVTTKEP